MYLSPHLKKVVHSHILKNSIKDYDAHVPLILGIHGPSGEGKTFQCEQILKEIGAKSYLISGGQLENKKAGEPAELIRKTYLRAGQAIELGNIAVLLINDIDTGIGDWGMVQYTINRQTVFGELMHLVDYPNTVGGVNCSRVPIIITGNDFSKLYSPLVRAGRMLAYEFVPKPTEKSKIINGIFPDLTANECQLLFNEFDLFAQSELGQKSNSIPIAFFSQLKSHCLDESLWKKVETRGFHEVFSMITKQTNFRLNRDEDFENIKLLGFKLLSSGNFINHLKK